MHNLKNTHHAKRGAFANGFLTGLVCSWLIRILDIDEL